MTGVSSMAAKTGMGGPLAATIPAPSGRVASRHALAYLRSAMAQILILVGTELGNAQMVADALKPVLEGAGHAVDVTDKAATAADLEVARRAAGGLRHPRLGRHPDQHPAAGRDAGARTARPVGPSLRRHCAGRHDLPGHVLRRRQEGRQGVRAVRRPHASATGSRSTPRASRCPTKRRWAGSRAGRAWSRAQLALVAALRIGDAVEGADDEAFAESRQQGDDADDREILGQLAD